MSPLPVCLQQGLLAGELLIALDDYIAVTRIVFDKAGLASRLVSGSQGAARSSEAVEDNITALRAIEKRILDHGDGLDRRMQHEVAGAPAAAKAVGTGIVPDIGAVASSAAQPKVVDVRRAADLAHAHQFMLRAVEAGGEAPAFCP